LTNAIKFTGPGADFDHRRAENGEATVHVRIRHWHPRRSRSDIRSLYQVEPHLTRQYGLGLGLAIARHDRFGGKMWVEARYGRQPVLFQRARRGLLERG
jgi:signal transduction histidine kinase